MTKGQAKNARLIQGKIDECITALVSLEIGSNAEKEMRKALESYQKILAQIKPGTRVEPLKTNTAVKGSEGFTSLI